MISQIPIVPTSPYNLRCSPHFRLLLLTISSNKKIEFSDISHQVLNLGGYEVTYYPVLSFDFMNERELMEDLLSDVYCGVIVTSPRAMRAMKRLVEGMGDQERGRVMEIWKDKGLLAVGGGTASEPCGISFSKILIGHEGSQALVPIIHQYWKELDTTSPLLFLCGNLRMNTLPQELQSLSVPFKELIVYKTSSTEQVDIKPTESQQEWLVFFSPSGVTAMLESYPLPENYQFWNIMKLAAIGPTTATALQNIFPNRKLDAVASKPTPEALLEALQMSDG